MITPLTPITSSLPPTYDGIWLTNINIMANNPNNTVTANIVVAPFNSSLNVISSERQSVWIQDVYALAATNQYAAGVMENLFNYIQDQVNSGSISF